MVCAHVRSIIPELQLGDYLSVQAHKACSIFKAPSLSCIVPLLYDLCLPSRALSSSKKKKKKKNKNKTKKNGKQTVKPNTTSHQTCIAQYGAR